MPASIEAAFLDAYCGPAPTPGELMGRWNADPVLLVGICLLGLVLAARGKRDVGARMLQGGLAASLFVVFVSPLCAASVALFSARALHHVLLVAVVAPLFVLVLPRTPRLSAASAGCAHIAAMWLWHAPQPYVWALHHPAAYWLMQLTLFATAVAFWRSVLDRTSSVLSAIVSAAAVSMLMGLLGALIAFAPVPLYAPHFATTSPWGLTPLEDQQLAGLVLWVVGAAPYLIFALRRLARLLSEHDRSASPLPG